MKKTIYTLAAALFLVSCHNEKVERENILLLKSRVITGDTVSYEKLSSYYFENNIDSLLPYSKIMANKYEYPRAFYDVYELIYLSNSGNCVDYNLNCLNQESKKIALSFFINAIKRKDVSASKILLNFYDKDKRYPVKELYEDSELIRIAKLNLEQE